MLAWDELYFAAQDPDPWAAMRAIKQINVIGEAMEGSGDQGSRLSPGATSGCGEI